MSSRENFSFPRLSMSEWAPGLRDLDMPEWGNVDGTLSGRVSKMDLDGVVDDYISEDDIVVEVGSSTGYTTTEVANISEAEVVGVDVPEAFSRGTVGNRYGPGPEPSYVSGLAPELPFKDDSLDGVVAFNSVTYLARNIGSLASEMHEDISDSRSQRLGELYSQGIVREFLEEFDRITGEDGYVLLGEQSDSSYLVLEKDGSEWYASEHGSFPEHEGDSLHIRYSPWIRDENVKQSYEPEIEPSL